MTYKQRLIDQGREAGRKEGREAGARAVLLKQLQLKFGELDPEHAAEVAAADLPQLETWSERVLTAESLEAIFES